MKALAAEEDWDGLRGYLDELETDLSTVDTVVKTEPAPDSSTDVRVTRLTKFRFTTQERPMR